MLAESPGFESHILYFFDIIFCLSHFFNSTRLEIESLKFLRIFYPSQIFYISFHM